MFFPGPIKFPMRCDLPFSHSSNAQVPKVTRDAAGRSLSEDSGEPAKPGCGSWRWLLAAMWAAAVLAVPANAAEPSPENIMRFYRPPTPEFTDQVVEEAMKRTVKRYGPYRIERYTERMVRERLFDEMLNGVVINAASTATQPTWEDKLIPIRIPVDMGILGYRIGMVRKDGQTKVSGVRNVADLKKLRIGVGTAWSSKKALEEGGFDLELAANQEALAKMLQAGRFDYFPRGVNEVFEEVEQWHVQNPDVVVEKDLLLSLPLPVYIFISPKAPQLAKRLTDGLESIILDGSLRKMLLVYYADIIAKSNMCSRRLIRITNPLLSGRNPLERRELWFDPFDPKTGICNQATPAPASAPAAKKRTGV